MENNLRFSIVVPIYNVEKFLDQCITSVLSQNYDNYELILVDDGATDWLAQIRQMKNRDIRTIEQSELEELPQDAVEHGLPQEERLKNLLDKVRNPYCYLDNGIIVKLNFAPRGSSTLSERVGRCFQSAS